MPGLDESLVQITRLDGVLAAALVDYGTGVALRSAPGEGPHSGRLPALAEDGAESVRLTRDWLAHTGLEESLQDILLTTEHQYQLLRVVRRYGPELLLLFVALDRSQANLALALRQISNWERDLGVSG